MQELVEDGSFTASLRVIFLFLFLYFPPLYKLSYKHEHIEFWDSLHAGWQGYEPQRGMYNSTYLDMLEKIVNMLSKYNIHVLLDAHQDVLNRKYCGEGVKILLYSFSVWSQDDF